MIQFTDRFIFVLTNVNSFPLAWLRGFVESGKKKKKKVKRGYIYTTVVKLAVHDTVYR